MDRSFNTVLDYLGLFGLIKVPLETRLRRTFRLESIFHFFVFEGWCISRALSVSHSNLDAPDRSLHLF